MIYPIVAYGDPVLKRKGKEIQKGTDIKQLVEDMYETMYNANGVGLAAPQIGKDLRLFVIDAEAMDPDNLEGMKIAFVNPEILEEYEEPWKYEEGCLSIPGIRSEVERLSKLKIRYYDAEWNEHVEEYDGLVARVIQHEYDHIEGKLFVDYLSPLKKTLLKGKLTDISKGKVDVTYRMKFPVKR